MAISDYGVNFNGRRIVHPGAYDAIDATAMTTSTPGSLNIPVVLGQADAGQSGVIHDFTNAEDAAAYLRGGDLVTALNIMFSPVPEGGGGASRVKVIIVNKTVQASLATGGIKATAVEYGAGGNKILTKLEDGTIPGTKKYTATRWDLDISEVYDNVGAVVRISYTGPEPYAAVNVIAANGKATKIEIKVGADKASATTDLSIDLTAEEFSTIDAVVRHIHSVLNYSAVLVHPESSGMSSSRLDAATEIDIKAADSYLMAIKGDLIQRINGHSDLVTVETAEDTLPLKNFDYTYLAGGSSGTVPTSWAESLSLIKRDFSDILVILSSDESIQAEALSHIGAMEKRNQKQVLFTGGASKESVTRVKQRAASLNNSRAVIAYPGIYRKEHQGGKVPLPGYFTGALLAGRAAGLPPGEPMTFDYFSVLGLDVDLLAGDPEVDDLITSGVATLEKAENGGFRLAQAVTTYLGSNNSLYREISVRRSADSLSERVRKTLQDKFVGKRKGGAATILQSSVTTAVIGELEQAIRDGDIVAYKNIVVRVQGSAVYVDFQAAPDEPTNYILITTHFVPEQ